MLIKKYDYNWCFKRIRQDVGSIKIQKYDKRCKWTERFFNCVILEAKKCKNPSESVTPPLLPTIIPSEWTPIAKKANDWFITICLPTEFTNKIHDL